MKQTRQKIGNSEWEYTESWKTSGKYSAKTSSISHNQTSVLPITVEVEQPGHVVFSFKVSSEENNDYLVFSIDGIEQARWSGEMQNRVWFPVSAGTHTFSWVYQKNDNTNQFADSAWIDEIYFPPVKGESNPWWMSLGLFNIWLEEAIHLTSVPQPGDGNHPGLFG